MQNFKYNPRWTALALAAATLTPAALAQDGSANAPDRVPAAGALEEIVVTSRRREESLADVPVAVTAFSASQLNALQIYAVKDIAAYSPGLNINSDSVGRAFVSIRGVGTTLIDTVQPGVGIFIDGIYQPNTSYLNSPLLDVERIEVLRGPQGTLFGNNTLGGAINVITQQPGNEFSGRASAAYAGPDDFQSASLSVSGALLPDVLQVRAGAAFHRHDGFMENLLVGGEGNPLEQNSANATIVFRPLDTATFTLNTRYDEVEGGSTPYRWVEGPTDYQYSALSNLNSIATYEYKSVDLTGEFDLAALNSTLTATGAFYRRDNHGDNDGDYGPMDFVRRYSESRLDTSTLEVRFDTEFNDRLSTLVGVFLNESETEASLLTTVVPLGVTAPSASSAESEALGIFANVFYRFSDSLELAAGLRYDRQELEGSAATTADTYKANEWQPRVSLTRFWSEELMTYASVARGFRAGGQNGPGAPNLIYQGDSVWTYEIGSKAQLLDRKLTLNLAAFYNDYSDFIGQNAIAPNQDIPESFVTIDLNTGDVESYGIEVEAHYTPTERWLFDASLTLLHARVTDDSAFRETTGFALPTDRILFTPDWNYYLAGHYVLPVGDNSLTFNLGLTAKGEREGSSLSETFSPTLKAYYLLDGFVAYQHGRFEVALFGKNLLNEEYFESYIDQSLLQRAGLPPALVSSLGIPGPERRVGLRVSMEF
ncbi:TonB-dependent receptor [Kineobactrum salinum]|uniref:TonB-dependent receptor n=1 Tax=Kineobactrum salinum TaxID=2708301 RepID=A0A6C0U5E8_9GAMM|nr:TonB-dependent receptor [Kineobactrum salinum]QIB67392.1 TonB-dependent receptor [Kineobactrum salinum]